jgi:hypothetical protein
LAWAIQTAVTLAKPEKTEMSIPPISSLGNLASIAGTDRAAASEVASGAAKRDGSTAGSAAADATIQQAEKVKPGDASSDSEADGRQMLDTFERQHRGDDEPDPAATDDADPPSSDPPSPGNRPPAPPMQGDHIDLTA